MIRFFQSDHASVRRRDGSILIGKMAYEQGRVFPWVLDDGGVRHSWRADGRYLMSGKDSKNDAVEFGSA